MWTMVLNKEISRRRVMVALRRIHSFLLVLVLLLVNHITRTIDGFHTSIQRRQLHHHLLSSTASSFSSLLVSRSTSSITKLWATDKKGFGKVTSPPTSSRTKTDPPTATSNQSTINDAAEPPVALATTTETILESSTSMNAGQRALQELRRQRIEERDQELRQVREMIQADEQVQNSGPVAIPEKVAQRMGLRMLPFVGVPFFGGMITFVVFWYYATYQNLQFEPTLVAASTIVLLVVGLTGITYSVMSASWDPDREGSFFGWDEFQINIQNIKDGLRRSRSNAILREKMSNLSTKEVQQALKDLDRRDAKK